MADFFFSFPWGSDSGALGVHWGWYPAEIRRVSCSLNGQRGVGRAWTCWDWGRALETVLDSRLGIAREWLLAEGFVARLGVEVEGDDWSLKDTRFFGAVRLADILGRISWDSH